MRRACCARARLRGKEPGRRARYSRVRRGNPVDAVPNTASRTVPEESRQAVRLYGPAGADGCPTGVMSSSMPNMTKSPPWLASAQSCLASPARVSLSSMSSQAWFPKRGGPLHEVLKLGIDACHRSMSPEVVADQLPAASASALSGSAAIRDRRRSSRCARFTIRQRTAGNLSASGTSSSAQSGRPFSKESRKCLCAHGIRPTISAILSSRVRIRSSSST